MLGIAFSDATRAGSIRAGSPAICTFSTRAMSSAERSSSLRGAETANVVARRLVVPPHREGGQAQFIPEPMRKTPNAGLASILGWMQANLNEELSVSELAQRAAMSPRTFARQFRGQTGTTPHQWLTHLRLLAAQRRLEQTGDSMDEVAAAVGWQTAATLRQHFSRQLSTSPTAYRRKFSTLR